MFAPSVMVSAVGPGLSLAFARLMQSDTHRRSRPSRRADRRHGYFNCACRTRGRRRDRPIRAELVGGRLVAGQRHAIVVDRRAI